MSMKERLRQRVIEMTDLIGISGCEWDVAQYIYDAVKDHVDSVDEMPNGTIVAIKKGAHPGPRVMVTAHMDEVGYEVKSISSKGFLYFDAVGVPTIACIPGRRVLVKGSKGVVQGVIGVRSAHLLTPEQMAKPQTVGQSYVDIGVDSKEDAQSMGIQIGAQIVPYSPCLPMGIDGDYMSTRAADDRALCAVMIETLKDLNAEDIHGEVIAVFNILEEATVQAIAAPIAKYNPEYGLILDTIPCGDVPDCDFDRELPVALKKGPVIVLTQALPEAALRSVSHPKLVEALREAVEETGAAHQEVTFSGAGYVTDAVSATYSGNGIAVATLAMPRRYSHSPVEIFHMSDMLATQVVVERFLKKEISVSMLKR